MFNGFTPDTLDSDVRFVLTATGQASGRRAQTTFTDAISAGASQTADNASRREAAETDTSNAECPDEDQPCSRDELRTAGEVPQLLLQICPAAGHPAATVHGGWRVTAGERCRTRRDLIELGCALRSAHRRGAMDSDPGRRNFQALLRDLRARGPSIILADAPYA